MLEDDFHYLSRRADEEMAAAGKAASPTAAQAHREMAERLRILAQQLGPVEHARQSPGQA